MNRLPDGWDPEDPPTHDYMRLPVFVLRKEVTVPVLTGERADELVARGLAAPAHAVPDTLAGRTRVSRRVLDALGLQTSGLVLVRVSPEEGCAFEIEVLAADFGGLPFDVRLGWDVLRHGVLSMNGPKGEFDLRF